jgi:triacylglycerol lipase
MGGLAARAYLDRHGAGRVAKLITLATPHHGTWLARLGIGRDARQMQPGSTWLSALKPVAADLPALAIWSPVDNFVAPQESARLDGTPEMMVPDVGHLSMLFSPAVLAILVRELSSPISPDVPAR